MHRTKGAVARYAYLPGLVGLALLTLLAHASTAQAELSRVVDCAAELDAGVALASHPGTEREALSERFATLEAHCPGFAQLAHNQGVLAAMDKHWPVAITHFQRALKKDQRAADTHRHLQMIFEFRAAKAYARALETPLSAKPLQLMFQDSTSRNAENTQQFPEHKHLRDVATIEYELYAWWQAQQNWTGIRGHYIDGYDIEAIKLSRQKHLGNQWPDTKREITFADKDAVIVLSDKAKAHTLLLMRLVGTRWKIYQETRL